MASLHQSLRALPQVEEMLQKKSIRAFLDSMPRSAIVGEIRAALQEERERIRLHQVRFCGTEQLERRILARIEASKSPSLKRAINASGVIVHTNLGRSALAEEALEALMEAARGYSTLEYDTKTRSRGSRHAHCEQLLCMLTGAEAALAVNNNAAAVVLVLSEFAKGHEAIVSRGELVEIGGSFRIPDIMAQSGTRMVEVGATNKTHESDYARAIVDQTSMLLKVHPSNYRMTGFTQSVGIAALRRLANKENERREAMYGESGTRQENDRVREVLVYEDQGSGAFLHLDCFGDYAEPTVAASLQQGADLVSFSGDKLLGGPQAGIIVGSKRHIERLKKNPLVRALRLDKMTLAALEATLRLYLDPEQALRKIPTLRMLTEPAETVRRRAERLEALIRSKVNERDARISIVDEISRGGGGALPMCDIETFAVQIEFLRGDALSCDRHLNERRAAPIVCRLKHEMLLCDARTILNDQEAEEIADALSEYFSTLEE
ncbi:L-seryl-tRNA(Sec) selenium transferase [Slackia piriformis]|uniref:L-seryl-tRNA(Sec) selenium transferase n=1 Tax=Slackia piriformis TaxID=626934 RepID=UPI0026DC6450|nr:L-seryl-tRNA(Sec) selenium transferase [Slackia piriformis]MDO5023249.1 L-seryl-tRNA(Sec) selenium transferase [Slackia piriformis]